MRDSTWQSAMALLISSLMLAPISITYALIALSVGLPTAVSASMMATKKRRYLRSLTLTKRRVGVFIFLIVSFLSVVVSIAYPDLAGPIVSSLTLSAFLPVSFIPSITEAIAESPEMRFRSRVWSEFLASLAVGALITMVYLGINILGLFILLGG